MKHKPVPVTQMGKAMLMAKNGGIYDPELSAVIKKVFMQLFRDYPIDKKSFRVFAYQHRQRKLAMSHEKYGLGSVFVGACNGGVPVEELNAIYALLIK